MGLAQQRPQVREQLVRSPLDPRLKQLLRPIPVEAGEQGAQPGLQQGSRDVGAGLDEALGQLQGVFVEAVLVEQEQQRREVAAIAGGHGTEAAPGSLQPVLPATQGEQGLRFQLRPAGRGRAHLLRRPGVGERTPGVP